MPAPEPSTRADVTTESLRRDAQSLSSRLLDGMGPGQGEGGHRQGDASCPQRDAEAHAGSAAPARPPVMLADEERGEGEADLVGHRQGGDQAEGGRRREDALPQRERPAR